jgi:hypothetical protein
MQKIFNATVGRSGNAYLTTIFNRFGRECIAEHEPPDLVLRQIGQRPFFRDRGWLGANSRLAGLGRNFQRRFIVTDEMMGRGQALEWHDQSDHARLDDLVEKKLRRIEKYERQGYKHYVELGQFFIRTFSDSLARRVPDLAVIKLTRDPLEAARSLANRNKTMFANSLPPDRSCNLFRIADWQGLSPFQLYLHMWMEVELRYHDFLDRHPAVNHFEIETNELSDPARVAQLFDHFGIAHAGVEALAPENTNKTLTEVSAHDIEEFQQLINLAPANLIDRVAYLKGYEPNAHEGTPSVGHVQGAME